MEYTLSQITTINDCNLLIEEATSQREDLEFKMKLDGRLYKAVTASWIGIYAELTGINAQIAGLEFSISNLPEGPTKEMLIIRLKKLEYRKFILEGRKSKYGVSALIRKEYNLTCNEQELAENQVLINALNTRKSQL